MLKINIQNQKQKHWILNTNSLKNWFGYKENANVESAESVEKIRTMDELQKEAESLPQYNFGLFGCWVNDGNNNLSYVDEEDYTDEMVEQQNLMASRNAATAQMNNMNNYGLKR